MIRDLEMDDVYLCKIIVEHNWGKDIAESAELELWEMFSKTRWPPHYLVYVDQNNTVVGFAGYKPAWLMSNAYEMIWINIAPWAQGKGIGKALTERRLLEITRRGGTMVLLMSQKADYFKQFGFNTVANLDGWELMLKQLAPVTLDIDRSSHGQ